jgi:protein-S-isoprenylcysteine O-methyltransferase Ste14
MLATIGIILILIGISFDIVAIVTVMRAFNKGTLITKGIFGICRHPVYAGWVVFIVPGIVLLVNSWIALSIPLVMYFFLRILVIKEDTYLEKTFGNEYHIYKKRIPAVLPIGWIK